MSVRFGVLLALAFGGYLASQNTSHVQVVAAEWAWTDRCPSCRSWNTSRP